MINYDRIKIFYEKGATVHISCDGVFYNGEIIDINNVKKFLILKDKFLGETPIMFEDILKIEPYVEEGK